MHNRHNRIRSEQHRTFKPVARAIRDKAVDEEHADEDDDGFKEAKGEG